MNAGGSLHDAQFIKALEGCALPESEFSHAAHVRAAYLYLKAHDFAEALARIRRAIRGYTVHLGRPDRYHETITVAYAALIQQRIFERGDGGGWAGFARANPELLQSNMLRRFYPPAQLESPMARAVFVLPRCL